MRTLALSIAIAAGLTASADAQTMTTVRVAVGLARPVFVTHAPGIPNLLFIVEQRSGSVGRVRVLDLDTGVLSPTPVLSVTVSTASEQGLLGLAFHPDFQNNRQLFISYTNSGGTSVISKWILGADNVATNPDTIFTQSQPQANHNGGWIGFGPDGFLYIALGDGGGAGDTGSGHNPLIGNSQDLNTNLGKMLRIDVDGDDFPADPGRDYAIPADNPFVGISGNDEIWAYGLRNPWRNGFDRVTGDLWIADVGQDAIEEINFQPASSTGGENYGWRCYEGNAAYNTSNCDPRETMTFPVRQYSRGGSPFRCSITGGYLYRGCAIPEMLGHYFYADYCSNQIWTINTNGGFPLPASVDRTSELAPGPGLNITSISSFGEDFYGELYICDLNGGEVFKIVPRVAPPDADGDGIPDACEIPCSPADLSSSSDPSHPGYGVPDQMVDSADFFYFLDQFVAGNLAVADLSGSSDPNDPAYGVPDGQIDASDFFYFLDIFTAGCP
ncbi:MAG: PQQ-dependent sugar dehydrogenase [Phycisphaeraceae bacterium]|nr:PQQ-dependent sugar dehydrogenase [Phycisphaeraceae bacterium]